MIGRDASIDRALRTFAAAVTAKTARVPAGAPEERMRAPFETLMAEAAGALGWEVVCASETALSDRFGRPDFTVHRERPARGLRRIEGSRQGRGREPLQVTTDLLEPLWVLEATVALYPAQADLLREVVAGRCLRADDLPPLPTQARQPPDARTDTPSCRA